MEDPPSLHLGVPSREQARRAGKPPAFRPLRLLAAICIGAPVCACKMGVLDPQGPIAAAERLILINTTAIMLVVVLPVILLTLAVAWWFRSSNSRAGYNPDWSYSGHIELVVWSIPAMVVILLGGVGWISSHALDPRQPIPSPVRPLEIEVVSLDWKWLFIYPQQKIAAVNQLVIPVKTPVNFRLTSATVMNSFFVPQLGSQIYTMAGMATRLSLLADNPGEYPGLSAQFSGDGFSDMHFLVKAVTPGEFDAWVAGVRGTGAALDRRNYALLARRSKAVAPITYRTVDPELFEAIVNQTAPPPEKARLGMSGPVISPRSEN
jgi:cytochrome o ubiquinol oxidase subunit 2